MTTIAILHDHGKRGTKILGDRKLAVIHEYTLDCIPGEEFEIIDNTRRAVLAWLGY